MKACLNQNQPAMPGAWGVLVVLLVFGMLSAYADDHGVSRKEIRQNCEIQERLTLLGFEPGPVDGRIGKRTRQAVGSFMERVKPSETELSGEAILNYLRSYQGRGEASVVTSRPRNGQVFLGAGGHAIAPLEIRTSAQGHDIFVKLADSKTADPVKAIYIQGGAKITTKMPLGNYSLKYATGKQWYSSNCLFGVDTLFSKADKTFEFSRRGNEVNGYSIELILQVDGNLSTSTIELSEW